MTFEERVREAMATARNIQKQLFAGGMEKKNSWGLAIHKACKAWHGDYSFSEFRHEVANRFYNNAKLVAKKRIEKEQLSLNI